MRMFRPKKKPAAVVDWQLFQSMTDSDRLKAYQRQCSWPGLYYSSTSWLLRVADVRHFVEVGVAYGYHGVHLLSEVPELEYTGVDPYLPSYDEQDIFASDVASLFGCDPQAAMDRLHAAVAESLAEASSGRARLLRTGSVEGSQMFDDESLDAVFIDGNHLTDAVRDDIASWLPKLKPGGLLIGDVYHRSSVKIAWDDAFGNSAERNMHLLQNGTSGYKTVVVRKS